MEVVEVVIEVEVAPLRARLAGEARGAGDEGRDGLCGEG